MLVSPADAFLVLAAYSPVLLYLSSRHFHGTFPLKRSAHISYQLWILSLPSLMVFPALVSSSVLQTSGCHAVAALSWLVHLMLGTDGLFLYISSLFYAFGCLLSLISGSHAPFPGSLLAASIIVSLKLSFLTIVPINYKIFRLVLDLKLDITMATKAASALGLLAAGRILTFAFPLFHCYLLGEFGSESCLGHRFVGIMLFFVFSKLGFLQCQNGLLATLQGMLWTGVSKEAVRQIFNSVFCKLQDLAEPGGAVAGLTADEALRILDKGTRSFSSFFSIVICQACPVFIDMVLAVFFLAFGIGDAWLALIATEFLVLYVGFTLILTRWKSSLKAAAGDIETCVFRRASDALSNCETVRVFNSESFEANAVNRLFSLFLKADSALYNSQCMLNILQRLLVYICIFIGSSLSLLRGRHSDAMLFVSFVLTQLDGPLSAVASCYRSLDQNFSELNRLVSLLDIREKRFPPTSRGKDTASQANPEISLLSLGGIVFEGVHFGYAKKKILDGISFRVPGGQTFALVGPSGSGKSTILKLLLRLCEYNVGHIRLGNQDLSTLNVQYLRSLIGVVLQDTAIFYDTLRANISFGSEDASEDEIEAAAKAASIHESILALPNGYDTVVGSGGPCLSGGERQRIGIARALLRRPRILILDEATSALDALTEQAIHSALCRFPGRTTLIIAHRLSTVVSADCILVLRDGKVAESGSHSELMGLGGLYSKMWASQHRSNLQ